MVLVIQAADGKSSDGHLLQLRLTHNVHTFASFFCLSYNSHYLCFHWVNYSFLISGLTVTLTLSPFRLNDLAVGFNVKEMIITC